MAQTARQIADALSADLDKAMQERAAMKAEAERLNDLQGQAFTDACPVIEELIAKLESSRNDYLKLRDRAAQYAQIAAEDEAAAAPAPAAQARNAARTATFKIGTERNMTADSKAEARSLWRSDNGEVATVSRTERMADHPVVKRELERSAGRDQAVVDAHGTLGGQLRAMSTSSASAIVPTIWSTGLIDLARSHTVCMEAGASVVPMPSKVYQIGRLTQDVAPAWKAEGSPITASDAGVDYIQLQATTLSALCVVSREFLMDAPEADAVVQESLAKSMALSLDNAILYGQLAAGGNEPQAGNLASPSPKGILPRLVTAANGHVLGGATDGTAQTAGKIWDEILDLRYSLLNANEVPGAIVSNTKLRQFYAKQYDTLGQPLGMPAEIAAMPWLTTNQIGSFTAGTMKDKATDIFIADWSQVLVGQRLGVEIRSLTERYAENGQVAFLAYFRGDVALARPTAASVYRYIQGA